MLQYTQPILNHSVNVVPCFPAVAINLVCSVNMWVTVIRPVRVSTICRPVLVPCPCPYRTPFMFSVGIIKRLLTVI